MSFYWDDLESLSYYKKYIETSKYVLFNLMLYFYTNWRILSSLKGIS